MTNDPDSFDNLFEEVDVPAFAWSEEPVETYQGFHIFDQVDVDGVGQGYGYVRDEVDVIEQAPLGTITFHTLEDTRAAIDEVIEMQRLIDR